MTSAHFERLSQRALYLAKRIEAKRSIGWETQYDESEREALDALLAEMAIRMKGDKHSGYGPQ